MDQEPADEFADVERHRRVPAGTIDPVILDLVELAQARAREL